MSFSEIVAQFAAMKTRALNAERELFSLQCTIDYLHADRARLQAALDKRDAERAAQVDASIAAYRAAVLQS